MRILFVAYPLLTVSDQSAGGAEQVLWTLERELAARGIATVVAASAGSRVSGALFSTGHPSSAPDDFERRNHEHQQAVVALLRRDSGFDLVHDMSGSFWPRASEIGLPVLATLHLPRSFYPEHFFEHVAPHVLFNCVSQAQADTFADLGPRPAIVHNGIALDFFRPAAEPREALLWLGRICEEKAPHLALGIAAQSDAPIALAGEVYPFSYHQAYFEREVLPRLQANPAASFVRQPAASTKLRLLQRARALLITSQVDETSSLVAMEAAACGTPVVAFSRGALAEVVVHGRTGFLVSDCVEAVSAVARVGEIDPAACREHARQNFSAARMADDYLHLYAAVLRSARAGIAA